MTAATGFPRAWRRLAGLLAVAALTGCTATGYYWQAAAGQFQLWQSARPVGRLLADPATSDALRRQLALAARLRDFASRELGLPDNGSFRSYADLGRAYVVWNVFAAPEFEVEPRQWCFPVAGCVSYRGYFAHADALAYAGELRAAGLDVHVGGVPAYSTLGVFDDPLLNTFIQYPEPELARLIFHELAHQAVYAHGDTEFNEAFAVVVETEGLRRWTQYRNDPALTAAASLGQTRRRQFADLVLAAREELRQAYATAGDDATRRHLKAQILARLQQRYRQLRDGPWLGFRGYDRWFGQEINNATLASIGLYEADVPAFQRLLAQQHGDLGRFYRAVRALAQSPAPARRAELDALAAQTLPPHLRVDRGSDPPR